MCINNTAEIKCGFIGADPDSLFPDWRIVLRSDDGSIISDITHDRFDVKDGHINGLKWDPDRTNGSNSKLLVGPVNKTHNQSSYQCIFRLLNMNVTIVSEVGTITVVGKYICMWPGIRKPGLIIYVHINFDHIFGFV